MSRKEGKNNTGIYIHAYTHEHKNLIHSDLSIVGINGAATWKPIPVVCNVAIPIKTIPFCCGEVDEDGDEDDDDDDDDGGGGKVDAADAAVVDVEGGVVVIVSLTGASTLGPKAGKTPCRMEHLSDSRKGLQ